MIHAQIRDTGRSATFSSTLVLDSLGIGSGTEQNVRGPKKAPQGQNATFQQIFLRPYGTLQVLRSLTCLET